MDGTKQKLVAIRFSKNIGKQESYRTHPSIYQRDLSINDFSLAYNLITNWIFLDTCVRINVSLYWITFSSFLSVFYFGFPLQKILAGTFSRTNAGRVCLGQEWFKFEHKLTGFENRRKVIPSKQQHNLCFRKMR